MTLPQTEQNVTTESLELTQLPAKCLAELGVTKTEGFPPKFGGQMSGSWLC